MIRKLILIFIALSFFSVCFAGSIQDMHKAAIARKKSGDPCTVMGASGTYVLWANADYPGDVHYACKDSGTGVDATAEVAGVAVVGGKINGTYGYLLNAANEHVRWDCPSNTIDAEGTIEMQITVPATTNGDTSLAEIYTDSQNYIYVYFSNTSGLIYGGIKGSDAHQVNEGVAVSDGTSYTILYTWRTTGTEKHCTSVNGGVGWTCQTEDLTAFAGTTDDIAVGDDQNGNWSITDSWKVDDFKVREGYEGD